jgi:hypothetical protein
MPAQDDIISTGVAIAAALRDLPYASVGEERIQSEVACTGVCAGAVLADGAAVREEAGFAMKDAYRVARRQWQSLGEGEVIRYGKLCGGGAGASAQSGAGGEGGEGGAGVSAMSAAYAVGSTPVHALLCNTLLRDLRCACAAFSLRTCGLTPLLAGASGV